MPLQEHQEGSVTDRRRKRRAARVDPKDAEEKLVPVSEAEMLNLPVGFKVGGLTLKMESPTIRKALQLQEQIFTTWPHLIVTAASAEIGGTGIDAALVAATLNVAIYNRQQQQEVPEDVEPVTESDVATMLASLGLGIIDYMPPICDTLWPLCKETPGLAWPRTQEEPPAGCTWLDDAILDNVSVPQLADLMRAMLKTLGGFPGGPVDRFFGSAAESGETS